MQHKPFKRLLSGILAVAVAVNGLVISTLADNNTPVEFTKVSNKNVSASIGRKPYEEKEQKPEYAANDVVRVSIFLKDKSTIEAGFEVKDIAENVAAINYREGLQRKQDAVVTEIERVTKKDLDVVWNLTLAANLISANVEYGQIEKIEKLNDVKKVVIEPQYELDVIKQPQTTNPNMATSSAQIGSSLAWAAGYTGAGSRIAVIDTGTDDQHQSFNEEAYLYSLSKLAEKEGKSLDAYIEGLNLLTADEIAEVADQLNIATDDEFDPEAIYLSAKLPFAYNYYDHDYNIDHSGGMSEHGSHVAGIATANTYVKGEDGSFVPALSSVFVQGVAPDAQLITMKVFNHSGTTSPSDYMAAIEDAIVLKADAINLSIGSSSSGMARASVADYQEIMDNLVECGVVVSISAGNNGAWTDESLIGNLYSDDVAFHTGGSPGTYTNALTVASIDNAGKTGLYFTVGDNIIFYNDSSESYDAKAFSTLAGEHEYVLIDGFGTPEEWAALGEGALEGKIAVCSRGTSSFYQKANAAVEAGAIATIIYNNEPGVIGLNLTGYLHDAPCVSILQSEGKLLKDLATAVEVDAAAANAAPAADETAPEAEEAPAADESSETEEEAAEVNNIFDTETEASVDDENGAEDDASADDENGAEDEAAAPEETDPETEDENSDAEEEAPAEADNEEAPAQNDTQAAEDEKVTYYLGSLTVGGEIGSAPSNAEFYTMSSFSSWGVPGSLTLKPEITAPGGDIYSVNGAANRTEDYENMSGTSMAAPQIAGIAAVAAQYVRDKELAEKTGEDERTLIQSLIMSTAEPVFEEEGVYYSVLNQGAGLANISNVINADSYILMGADATDSYKDGKVKVELGDDPDKNGEYSFSFSVNNLTAEEKTYDLSAILFTQAIEDDFLIKTTASLASEAVFSGSGVSGNTVTVGANGSAEVTVVLTLTDSAKTALEDYVNGAYIEGYIFVKPSGANADKRVEHSIPVLGFYGNWSEPSMFDVGSYVEYFLTGEEERLPYLITVDDDGYIELDALMANAFTFTNAEDKNRYPLGGNPYDEDEEYIPERVAVNGGNALTAYFAAIRNAADSRFAVYGDKGLLASKDNGMFYSAYYGSSGWASTSDVFSAGSILSTVAENTEITLAFEAALEYYVDDSGNTAWDKLGKGAALTMPAVVDNTAPDVLSMEVNKANNKLIVTVQDNQYVAAIALFDRTGRTELAKDGAVLDAEKGAKTVYELPLDGIQGKKFLIQVYDYAMNTATYEFKHQIGEDVPLPEMIAFDFYGYEDHPTNYWVGLNEDIDSEYINENPYSMTELDFIAATIADHFVFACTSEGELYVMPEYDLTDRTKVCDLTFTEGDETYSVLLPDMAYNYVDSNVYAISGGTLLTVDKLTGELEIVGDLPFNSNTLACDKEGNFYCNELGTGKVYTFTLDSIDEEYVFDAQLLCEYEGFVSGMLQAMEVNPDTGILWWTACNNQNHGPSRRVPFIKIDPATGELTVVNENLVYELGSLIIPETEGANYDFNDDGFVDERDAQALLDYRTGVISEIANEENADFDGNEVIDSRDAYLFLKKLWYAPTKNVTGIQIDTEATLTVGFNYEISSAIQPWTAADKSITWTSSDESVATVDKNGVITAEGVGECTITAVPNANDSISATCKVTVVGLDITIEGALQDEEGAPLSFEWNMAESDKWTSTGDFPTEFISATKFDRRGLTFAVDWDGKLQAYHTATNTHLQEFGQLPFYDMDISTQIVFDEEYNPVPEDSILGINGSDLYHFYLFGGKENPLHYLDLSQIGIFNPVAVASEGVFYLGVGTIFVEIVAVLDNTGTIQEFLFLNNGDIYLGETYDTGIKGRFKGYQGLPLTSMVYSDNSDDGYGCFYIATMDYEDNTSYIYCADIFEDGTCKSGRIGNVGDGVWPAALFSGADNSTAQASYAPNFFSAAPALSIADGVNSISLDSAEKISSNKIILDSEFDRSEAISLSNFAAATMSADEIMAASETDSADKSAKKLSTEIEELDINVSEIMAAKANASDNGAAAHSENVTARASEEITETVVEVEDEGDTFKVELGALDENGEPVDSVNGVAIVTYDPEALELVDVEIDADYTSANILAEDGVVILGYVNAEEVITAETLTFEVKDIEKADGTLVNIDVTEQGDLDEHRNELDDLSSPLDGSAADEITADSTVKVQVKEEPDEPDEPDEPYVPVTPPGSGSEDEGGKIVLEDKDTGVKVEVDKSDVPSGAELDVEETGRDDNSVSVDVSIVAGGAEVKPGSEMVVTIPVPEGLNGDDCHVYRVEADGTYTDMNAVYADGVLTFTTNRLGEFMVSTVKPGTSDPADTGKPAESEPAGNDPTGTNEPDVTIGSGDGNNGEDPGNVGGDTIPGTGVVIAVIPAAVSALAVLASKKHRK